MPPSSDNASLASPNTSPWCFPRVRVRFRVRVRVTARFKTRQGAKTPTDNEARRAKPSQDQIRKTIDRTKERTKTKIR